MRRALIAVLTLSLSMPTAALAQAPNASATIDVTIVNLDVFVTDRQGNRVRGLTGADFEVRENGKVQPISNFTEYSGAPQAAGVISVDAAGPKDAPATPQAKRTIIVFVEQFALPPTRTKALFDGLRALLRRSVRKGDAAAVVSWSRKLEVRQQLTDDLDKLDQALTAIQADSRPMRHADQVFAKRQLALEDQFQDNMQQAELDMQQAGACGVVPP